MGRASAPPLLERQFVVENPNAAPLRSGLAYGVAAYGWWGLMPLYFAAVKVVPPKELLAHRVVWSAALLGVVIVALRRGPNLVRCLRSARTMRLLGLSTLFIAFNWYIYIYSVITNQTIESSLGYFILPLVNVAVGMFFFGERLRPLQAVALLLSGSGVAVLIAGLGTFPWIALSLAFSFCIYGVIRKEARVDGVIALTVETGLLAPLALGCMAFWLSDGALAFGHSGPSVDVLLVLSSVVTTVPLLCFAEAVQRLTLITVGFLQYLSPTIQFLIAVFYFGEAFTAWHQRSFALIWAALAIFLVDAVLAVRQRAQPRARPVKPRSGEWPAAGCRR